MAEYKQWTGSKYDDDDLVLSLDKDEEATGITDDLIGEMRDPALPFSQEKLEELALAVQTEWGNVSGSRTEQMERMRSWRDIAMMVPYRDDELLTPGAENMRGPLTAAKIADCTATIARALDLTPYFQASTSDGQGGSWIKPAEYAFEQALERGGWREKAEITYREGFTVGSGYVKMEVVPDGPPDATGYQRNRFLFTPVKPEQIIRSPHTVDDLEECNMIAHRYYMTLRELRDWAIDEYISREVLDDCVSPSAVQEEMDGDETERDIHGVRLDNTSVEESGWVEIWETYVRVRLDESQKSSMMRLIIDRRSWSILRAEEWEDGFPFSPIRPERPTALVECIPIPAKLESLQAQYDMLIQAAIEQDKLNTGGIFVVRPNSPVQEWLEDVERDTGSAAITPNTVIPGDARDITTISLPPYNNNIQARMQLIQGMADQATIPTMPFNTAKSATETRYVSAQISEKQQTQLKSVTVDLVRLMERAQRLFWKYIAEPIPAALQALGDTSNKKLIRYGRSEYTPTENEWFALKFTPRGTSTAADKVLSQQSVAFLGSIIPQLMQKPVFEQAGIWPYIWNNLRYGCEAHSIADFELYIGPNPQPDPREKREGADTAAPQAAMLQYFANANNRPLEGPAPTGIREDNVQTTVPGGGGAIANDMGVLQ